MSTEDFKEFAKRIVSKSPRKYKITNSWGTYDYYKYYRKNKPKQSKYVLSESQYFSIIRRINQELGDQLLRESILFLPLKFGRIEVRKLDVTPKIGKDGEMIYNKAIDWDKTLKLWYDDEEAYINKILLKQESKEIFRVLYNKTKAIYTHKSFYQFRLNDEIKHKISQRIRDGRFDAYNLYQQNYD